MSERRFGEVGALFNRALAPEWLQAIAVFNPFSWAVEGTRALFAGNLGDDSVWQGLSITAVLAALAVMWAAREFASSVR